MRSSPAAQSCFPAMKASTNPHCWFCRAVTNQVDLLGARSKSFALSHQALPALFPAVPVGKPGYLKAVDWNILCINICTLALVYFKLRRMSTIMYLHKLLEDK